MSKLLLVGSCMHCATRWLVGRANQFLEDLSDVDES